jgi:hypothetical protein
MDRLLWLAMVKDLRKRVHRDDVLVSGGAAWADHLAVHAYLEGWCAAMALYLPAPLAIPAGGPARFEGMHGSAGAAANYYHDRFAQLAAVPGLEQLAQAAREGAAVQFEPAAPGYAAMFTRNRKVATGCTAMLAYTFGEGAEPADGGTLNTWSIRKDIERIHVPLGDLQRASAMEALTAPRPGAGRARPANRPS